ncbi:30S ribosomal protein S6 [Mycoplasma sp. ES3157-GEN-MYC]|uniref:Small ribosomal subunit protein bS6 n=1 Tax=Mycoplasma miroungigenitalium TaxID=754515 RepID=A0A6M4JC24_9MOLU|nr:30S ribosomal protein S6 [Mycoplasma miroungigenitalium]MBU4690697.1 30S ribosomal protein S6 [Mycoplasma miroungigenitalium]MBU4691966.1 30S ribosomal protein S6 [Mycoplasma miroungigenitalium]QJR43818.1 30S ribosomal protein S6 [Mycoplasma miroungigenitalium]
MHKYEIMMLLDPKANHEIGFELVESVFGKSNIIKAEKLENTTLAYPVNHSTQGQYLLIQLNGEASLVAEFVRRSNISKEIWRQLVINLDTEKGLGKERKTWAGKKVYNPAEKSERRPFKKSYDAESKVERKPRTPKAEKAE